MRPTRRSRDLGFVSGNPRAREPARVSPTLLVLVLTLPALFLIGAGDRAPKGWPGRGIIGKVLKKSRRTDDFERFVKSYNSLIRRFVMTHRLGVVAAAQEDPLSLPDRTYALTDSVHDALAASLDDPSGALGPIARALDVNLPEGKGERLRGGIEGEAHLTQIQEVLEAAGRDWRRAFRAMPKEDVQFLVAQAPILTDQFLQHIYLEDNGSNYEANKRAIELGGKIDLAALLSAAQRLCGLYDEKYLDALVRDMKGLKGREAEGVTGVVLLERETPLGRIVVGGRGDNEYDMPAAVIIDLGGDDRYGGAPASSRSPGMPFSIIIDVAGDDRYQAEGEGLGLGVVGVAILADLGGKDSYRAGRRSLGCGLFGVGLVLDGGGNDSYSGTEYTQGAAAFGVGVLIDHAGKDQYKAELYGQGFGLPRGFGVLWDGEGRDSYVCTGTHPSVYGDKGEYNGMGQGIGMGFRGMQRGGLAAGGIGALLDGGGDDVYRAGQFGLGCGYYFGMGIVRDRGGNDNYEASRYGLGTGAHYALGIVIDDRGNDRYVGRGVASQAGNWDLTISYLIDGGGNDTYKATGLCQGSATITSLAVLADAGGSDVYEATSSNVQGHGGHGQDGDRKTKSFGFLLDFGKGRDTYKLKGAEDSQPRENKTSNLKISRNRENVELGLGYFVDSPKRFR